MDSEGDRTVAWASH